MLSRTFTGFSSTSIRRSCLSNSSSVLTTQSTHTTRWRNGRGFTSTANHSSSIQQIRWTLFFLVAATSGVGLGYGIFAPSKTAIPDEDFTETNPNQPVGLNWKYKVYPALDLAAATAKLKASETSQVLLSQTAPSVTRFDSIRLPAQTPTEDEMAYEKVGVGDSAPWHFWGVYDGHAGWATSSVLRHSLISYVARELKRSNVTRHPASATDIEAFIKTAFLSLDNNILSAGLAAIKDTTLSHAEIVTRAAQASAGSCALLALLVPVSSILRVACVGDSRAVLGRWTGSSTSSSAETTEAAKIPSKWTATPMSVDQTGFNEFEQARLAREHPGETDIIDLKTGRVLGIMISRAFGDNRWKWPAAALKTSEDDFFGKKPRPGYLTPPYLTAEPEIQSTKVQKGDFLILASDGLWDVMTSEDAVTCVGMWIEAQKQKSKIGGNMSATAVTGGEIDKLEKPKGYTWPWSTKPETWVVEDDNAATHLVRNALGGKQRDLFCSVMSLQAPEARETRDDITVQVIFFGDAKEDEK